MNPRVFVPAVPTIGKTDAFNRVSSRSSESASQSPALSRTRSGPLAWTDTRISAVVCLDTYATRDVPEILGAEGAEYPRTLAHEAALTQPRSIADCHVARGASYAGDVSPRVGHRPDHHGEARHRDLFEECEDSSRVRIQRQVGQVRRDQCQEADHIEVERRGVTRS